MQNYWDWPKIIEGIWLIFCPSQSFKIDMLATRELSNVVLSLTWI